MNSLVMLFFAGATFLLGTSTLALLDLVAQGGWGLTGSAPIVQLVTVAGPLVFLVGALAFARRGCSP